MNMATSKMKVSSYMDRGILPKLRVLAAMKGVSLSNYIESVMKEEIAQAENKGIRFELLKIQDQEAGNDK